VEALRNHKIKVKGMAAVFNYGFDKAAENMKLAQVDLISLCDYNILITQALKSGYISEKDIETLEAWRKKPETWGQK
jgi:orotate phosphoribosyltransferase